MCLSRGTFGFSVIWTLSTHLHMDPFWSWKTCISGNNGTVDQWVGGQEYQELLWVSFLSKSQGTPQIIVHPLLLFKLELPVFFSRPALTHAVLSRGHVFGDVPHLESYLKPFYQLKQTLWTSLSVVSQLSLWILQQVSKCQASSMLLLLSGVDSVISTCGMCQCDQRGEG